MNLKIEKELVDAMQKIKCMETAPMLIHDTESAEAGQCLSNLGFFHSYGMASIYHCVNGYIQ